MGHGPSPEISSRQRHVPHNQHDGAEPRPSGGVEGRHPCVGARRGENG